MENTKVAIRVRPQIKKEQGQSIVLEQKDGKLYNVLMEKNI
jgi:hypothetical protein